MSDPSLTLDSMSDPNVSVICLYAILAYRHIRNRVNSLNTKLKKAYFSQKIADCQGNMRETWNTINKLINKRSKTTNISSLMVDEECLTKSSEIADSTNDYFCNIGSKLSSKIPNLENPLLNGDYSINEKHARFHFQTIRPDELSKIMNKFKKLLKVLALTVYHVLFSKLRCLFLHHHYVIYSICLFHEVAFQETGRLRGSLLSTKMAPPKIDLTIDLFLCFL